jgi:tetratricopeptide (TPR) repeat protein
MADRKKKRAQQQAQRQSSRAAANAILRRARTGGAPPSPAPPAADAHRRAIALWNGNRFDEAVAAFESAHRAAPGDAVLAADCAKAMALRYRREEARALFDQLTAAHPGDPFPCIRAGEAFVEAQDFPAALTYYHKAAALPHCGQGAWMGLARICERLHRLEDAAEALERARSIHPDLPMLVTMDAQLARRRGETERAERILREELSRPVRDPEARWRAWYELAAICDARGEYDEAWECALHAKRITAAEAERYRQVNAASEAEGAALIAALQPEHLRRWMDDAPEHPPLAVLTGYPRSGTTLIEQVLDAHDGLVSADESIIMSDDVISPLRLSRPLEVPWLEVLDSVPESLLDRLRLRYFAHSDVFLGARAAGRVLLDKNPAMTLALPSVIRAFPRLKCLIALRDPRDVVISCFFQAVPPNAVSAHWHDTGDAVRHLAAALQGWKRLREVLPAKLWMEVRYEETTANLTAVARRALEFLELPWDDRVLAFHEHARRKHVHSPTYAAVTEPVHRRAVGRWRHYVRWLEPHLPVLEPFCDRVAQTES